MKNWKNLGGGGAAGGGGGAAGGGGGEAGGVNHLVSRFLSNFYFSEYFFCMSDSLQAHHRTFSRRLTGRGVTPFFL